MYIAHKNEDGQKQSILEHTKGTAELAREFARPFGAGDCAYELGMAHDIGKYSPEFQRRILENGPKVDHSTAGALEIGKTSGVYAALCAAGHHTGLPDLGNKGDEAGASTLMGRLKKAREGTLPDYQAFASEVRLRPAAFPAKGAPPCFDTAFLTRMLFSTLVDADFQDTERFMQNGRVKRGGYDDIPTLFEALKKRIAPWWNPENDLNARRSEILRECLNAGAGEKGIYTLTVPTGGGKTISSLAFALRHAVEHGMERVIYVIPYTSIIEQTAEEFRKTVGAKNVLEHHANVDFDALDDDVTERERHRLSTENWDAPIVVTTNVQFFESLYASKTSRCRKLHNIANSVVIFDEAQMLPLPYLRPCVRGISSLVRDCGVTAVLCTATQPSLQKFFPPEQAPREICKDPLGLYAFFRRAKLQDMGLQTLEALAEQMAKSKQVMNIVGTRKQARELFELLPPEGRFHLSTLMYPVHRSRKLSEIRRRLDSKEPCRLVATSLMEAGVDVDFPAVLRMQAGLDSLIQAAGRCNREGKRSLDDSIVWIYKTEESVPPMVKQAISVLEEIKARFSEDLTSPEAIQAYFDALHGLKEKELDQKGIIAALERGRDGCLLPFQQVARDMRLIETQTKAILVPLEEEAKRLGEALRMGLFSCDTLRKAGRYMVNVYPRHWKALEEAGDIELVGENLAVLTNPSLYSDETGLALTAEYGKGLFI